MQPKKILLAEDDAGIAEVVALILKDNSFDVIVPKDYKEIIKLIDEIPFNLILLDMSLWGEDGIKICRKIRSGSKNLNTPVVLLTAKANATNLVDYIYINDIIEKPFEISKLLNVVEKNISKAK